MSTNNMNTKHTQTPWSIIPQSDGSAMIAREYETGKQMNPKGLRLTAHVMARGNSLAEDEANAAHIVHCVNNHDALVAALEYYAATPSSYGQVARAALLSARKSEVTK